MDGIDERGAALRTANERVLLLKSLFPDVQVGETDYGHTIGVKLPRHDLALYLRRVFRIRRDGFVAVHAMSPERFVRLIENWQREVAP